MYKEQLRERDRRKTAVRELGLVEAFLKENPVSQATGRLASSAKPRKRDPRAEVTSCSALSSWTSLSSSWT
jgi:hypothetical protein